MYTELQLYQSYTQFFTDDIDFYSSFIGEHEALELFAGFGRVSNPLIERGHNLQTVEICPEYAQQILKPPTPSGFGRSTHPILIPLHFLLPININLPLAIPSLIH